MLLFTPLPAFAGETPWQEIAPGVTARMISSDARSADGTTLVGLEINLPPGVKTYWRVPGETGIPTEFDFSASTGIGATAVIWPYPVIDRQNGYTDFVYHGPTVLPISLATEGESPVVSATVLMGVCSDICVPVTASFQLTLDFTKRDPGNGLRLSQAMALAPIAWDGLDEPIGDIWIDPASGSLAVAIAEPGIEPQSVIATGGPGAPLFGAPQKSPEPNLVLLPILGKPIDKGLEGQSISITFMTDMGPYSVTRIVVPNGQ